MNNNQLSIEQEKMQSILQEVLKKTTNFESYDTEECTTPLIVDSLFENNPEFIEWQLAMLEQCTKIAVAMTEELIEQRTPTMKYIDAPKRDISKYLDCVITDYPNTLNQHDELFDFPTEKDE